MPPAAVTAGGSPSIRSGSMATTRGISLRSAMVRLRWFTGSVNTAAIEASEPEPAVVGTQASGRGGSSTRNRPSIRCSDSQGLPARAAMPLAQSITDPPPTAIRESQPSPLKCCSPASTLVRQGFSGTRSNTVQGTPAAASAPWRGRGSPSCIRVRSVTSSGWRQPRRCSSAASCWLLPAPISSWERGKGSTRASPCSRR